MNEDNYIINIMFVFLTVYLLVCLQACHAFRNNVYCASVVGEAGEGEGDPGAGGWGKKGRKYLYQLHTIKMD